MFNNVKLGIAPIGWTNDDMPQLGGELTFEQMVSEAALAGFQGTEVGGKFPADPVVLNRALDLRGIKIASQWFSSFLCSTPYEENEKAFVMAEAKYKKPTRFYMLRVYPDGELSFHTWEQNLLENTTEQEKIAQCFTSSFNYFDRSVQGLIFEDEDNIHTIYNTDRFTLPNMQALEQLLRATCDDEQLKLQPIADAIREYGVSASEKEKEACQEKLLAIEMLGKGASRKQLRQLLNMKTKLGKKLNMFIFDRTGILIGDNKKSKDNRERLFGGLLGIRHFIQGNDQYYYSGYIDKTLNRSLPHACRIRKVCSTGQVLHFERYLPLLEVDFVRASGWTVLPFPFKYLREWMAQQH